MTALQAIFPDSFTAGLARLSLNVRAAPPRAAAGAHLSRAAAGASLAFRDYQSYTPGDDLRRVDWAVYGRTRHLFVRRFERPTAVPAFVLVDASASMFVERPADRYATAARVAAAIVSAALASANPVYLTVADGRAAATPRALTGRGGLVRALADLAGDRAPGRTSLSESLAALRPLLAAKGGGVLAVVSDFFDDGGVDGVIDALRPLPGRLVLLRITQPGDADPALEDDDVELADCETDAWLAVSPGDRGAIDRYRVAYRAYFEALDAYATARGATTHAFDASATDTLGQLARLFPGGVMTV